MRADRIPVRLAAGAALLCLAAGAAHADLTLVSEVTRTTNGRTAPAQKLVTYFKGGRLRSDSGSVVTLYDTAAKRIIRVDRARKTYMVLAQKPSRPVGGLARLQFKTTASVKPGRKTRVIAGKTARNYLADASLQLQLPGFPGGEAPTTRMQIEQWTTEAVSVPAETRRVLALASTGISGSLAAGMKPLSDALGKVRGLPLSSKVTLHSTRPGAVGGSVTSLTEVRSIKTGVLSEDLFRVPKGYRKVNPPSVARYARRPNTPPHSGHKH
jgi:hypothetical protein